MKTLKNNPASQWIFRIYFKSKSEFLIVYCKKNEAGERFFNLFYKILNQIIFNEIN
jgi:hypothetical protein